MKRRALLLTGLLLTQPGTSAHARQDSELDQLLHAAVEGKPHVRPQAARRIVRLWATSDEEARAAVVERLLSEAGEGTQGLADLGSALAESLGGIDDPRLRTRLWAAVDERDFPWRPYAARGLALTALEDEHPRFRAMLDDDIAPVRGAGITALEKLDAREDIPAIRARLADEVDLIRRAAADLLVRWGHPEGLWYLLEDLRRDDRFFDRPTGRDARYRAVQLLARHLGGIHGYDAGKLPAENVEALRTLAGVVAERAGERPELPAVVRADRVPAGTELVGLELRSCRRGEFFLRWTTDDRLWVGQGTPAEVALPEGTSARLRELGAATVAQVDARFYGTAGCDLELLHWRPQDTTETWIVSKGPDAVEDLRPDALGALFAELAATLPDAEHGDPRLDRLRSRALGALEVIGGAVE